MSSQLPPFRFHPDPVASGSVVASDLCCVCCRKARGYVYTGPVYAERDLDSQLCPWCIGDGKAHAKFDATFVDSEAMEDGVPDSSAEEICERTPGYDAWQSEVWPACCGDAMQYLHSSARDTSPSTYFFLCPRCNSRREHTDCH